MIVIDEDVTPVPVFNSPPPSPLPTPPPVLSTEAHCYVFSQFTSCHRICITFESITCSGLELCTMLDDIASKKKKNPAVLQTKPLYDFQHCTTVLIDKALPIHKVTLFQSHGVGHESVVRRSKRIYSHPTIVIPRLFPFRSWP